MLERNIKKYLVDRCNELDIYHRKFTSPGVNGVPDWILINNGKVVFLELKAPKKVPNIRQQQEIKAILNAGGYATFAPTIPEVEFLIAYLIE